MRPLVFSQELPALEELLSRHELGGVVTLGSAGSMTMGELAKRAPRSDLRGNERVGRKSRTGRLAHAAPHLHASRLRDSPRLAAEVLGSARDVVLDARPGGDLGIPSVADLTEAWARALAPQKYRHMRRVRAIAATLARAMRPHLKAGESLWDEDIRIAAMAHDLFRDVEPSRVLALFRELDMPGLRMDGEHGQPSADTAPTDWIQPTEWTIPILLHGRLAAVFRDFVLDASSRLGAERFSQIKLALATHTVGMRDAPPLSRLLVVADTLHVTSRNVEPGGGSGAWHHRLEQSCREDPSLAAAYDLCIRARVATIHDPAVVRAFLAHSPWRRARFPRPPPRASPSADWP